jgi:signal transduction histidine kinase
MRNYDGGQSILADGTHASSAGEAILRERTRLAGELHDVLAQNFQYILLQLDAARGVLGTESALAGRHVGIAQDRLKECWDEVRNCIHSLTPAALARGNLVAALGWHVAALSGAGPMAVSFEVCGTAYPLAAPVESQLLRIAQESVTNAMRHSGATRIAIELSFDADAVRLTVSDNGAGFCVRHAAGALGLGGMRERTRRVGGELVIDSDIGRGTEVRVSVPRETAAEHDEPQTADASSVSVFR